MSPPPIDYTKPVTFVVTDIEADGPSPLESSMLSFASVACDVSGNVIGEFQAVLEPRSARATCRLARCIRAGPLECVKCFLHARHHFKHFARGHDMALLPPCFDVVIASREEESRTWSSGA